jgi:maleylacetoacetate isomerase
MTLELYTFYRSSAAYRVRIALNYKGLSYTPITLHLRRNEHRRADYLSLNPQGLVPALAHDGAVIPQSIAIMEYLEERYPEPALLPAAGVDRALVRSMAQSIVSEMHPLCNLRVLNYLKDELGQDEAAVRAWYARWIDHGFGPLENMVERYGDGTTHCFGDSVTMADVCLVPQMFNARRFECDLTPYPRLTAIAAALEPHPAFAQAQPSAQPDAE